ncbi:S41 family peptidase [Chitinimonas sp. BJYL2]|uniref:S41 family peptidase n=1 Tax=Chitinimonas sp. BJYL2 TaxID=2976696 RepID=UPI0022B47FCD|nr:S41 family peptidase [Chitinimonas sp. BJYL2]
MNRTRLALGIASLLAAWPVVTQAAYLRFPALAQDKIVFTAEGDLWSAPLAGGPAQRLTTHAAEESRAAVSPDGKWIAFIANYEGPAEAYVMPVGGGQPQRLTFEHGRVAVLGWTAQGEVLYSAPWRSGPPSMRVISAVKPGSLARRTFPLADANDGVVDSKGEYLYFVRFGAALNTDNARYYRGGAMAQLWRYKLDGPAEAQRIGPQDANLKRPMLWNNRLLAVSDADGRDNLWSFALDGSDARQLTRHQDFDVRGASYGQNRVVYQLGADLRVLDLTSNQDRPVNIDLVSDFDQQRARWIDKPLKYLGSTRLSHDGERLVLVARGKVAIAGTGPQRRVEIAQPAGSRIKQAVLSRDGKSVYAICDATGEQEIWRFPADGSAGGKALTSDGSTQRLSLYLSPDGKQLAHTDKHGRLWLLDLASGKNEVIDDGSDVGNEDYNAVEWSADSRAIAIVRQTSKRLMPQLGLYSLDNKRVSWLTSDKYASGDPAFSPDGKWLYFLSDRQFDATKGGPWGDRNTGASFERRTKIYALALQAGNRFPFQPKDELEAGKNDEKKDEGEAKKPEAKADDKDKKPDDKKDAKPKLPAIAWNGLSERLFEVPLAGGDYRNLSVDAKRLYVLDGDRDKADLKTLAIENTGPKIETFASDVTGYQLSQDGKKLFYRKGKEEGTSLYIVEAGAKAPTDLAKSTVRLGDWNLYLEPRAEWQQMFVDAWRMHRDSLFDRKMRGVDWQAVRKHYAPLAERVTDRAELDDVLAQMIAELGALHSQVIPGDNRRGTEVAAPAGLGADVERIKTGWLISRIYRTEAELPSERGPLQAPGLDVREGDVILSINGRGADEVRDFTDLLRNQAGQQVLLEIKRGDAAPRKVVVTPVNARQQMMLRYNDWEQVRKDKVERAGKGQLGYLHLRAMGGSDMASFVREFYAQYERDGLIIDVRRNNGGNIDSWIIEKLLRRVWAFWGPPAKGYPYGNMQQTFRGHLVVLTDEMTYSDGETFAAGIKALKLGPVIGTRTSGAGVWLSDSNVLVDEGIARVAEFPQFGIDGQWLIEGVGVAPDIEVVNPPLATFKGEDKQLDAAIRYLQDKLAKEPIKPMVPEAIPPLRPKTKL